MFLFMKILILNWRDIKNPASGGAEILTHEMAKRWVKKGHEVTQFSSWFDGAKEKEMIDGIRFIRQGNSDARRIFESVHFRAFWNYRKYFKGKFDVVIDEIHGLPFFTPFYVKEKKVALICEVADKIWDINFPYPFNLLGKIAEKNYFKFYRNVRFLTISSSTKEDLQKFGIDPGKITVLPMGINIPKNLPKYEKEKSPTLIFIGRLTKAKGVEDALKLCKILIKDFPKIMLWIVGRGEKPYEDYIRDVIEKLSLKKNTVLWGFIEESKKFELIGRAHALIATSVKEGFGLTVPEAGVIGTPAVVYNVEGLRDIVKNGYNGIIVEPDPSLMAKAVKKIFIESEKYEEMRRNAAHYAQKLNWDNTAKKSLSILNSENL